MSQRQIIYLATALMIPMLVLPVVSFSVLRDMPFGAIVGNVSQVRLWLAIVAGVFAHELLHGVGYMAFGKVPWSQIRFGVLWKYLSPYAGSLLPMTVGAYRISAALPGLALGVLPWAAALWLGDANLLLFSALMFGAAAGDLVIVLQTLSLPRDAYVLDRPDAIGFEVVAPRAAD